MANLTAVEGLPEANKTKKPGHPKFVYISSLGVKSFRIHGILQ
jgi:hypothetical protein